MMLTDKVKFVLKLMQGLEQKTKVKAKLTATLTLRSKETNK